MGWTDAAGQDDLTRGLVGTGYGVQWNDDIVLRAPDETVVLARTPQGELQVARFAPTVWGVQLHPEVDVHILEQWADEDRDRYDEGVLNDVAAQDRRPPRRPASPGGGRSRRRFATSAPQTR